MRRFLFRFLILIILAAAGLAAFELFVPTGPSEQKLVRLMAGRSARNIGSELENEGIIRSRYAFLLWHYVQGRPPLKAGEYSFDHPARLRDVYDRVARGDIYVRTLVLPEGFNMFDIAAAVEAAGLGGREEFLEAARSETSLVRDLDPQAQSLEGYLFPDTYHFTRTQSARDMAAAMVHRFRQEAREVGLNQDVHKIVTMASIVEKETAVPEERPEVASVFYNRLEKGMVLATDPTVIYAALLNNRYRGTIYQSDLHFKSPYNTYHTAGLPPGPISNPGKSALLAAMHPAQTSYFYFVSDNQGHHKFSRTGAEHARNVAAYRRASAASANR